MKVKVNRQLSAGIYHVNFQVGEFMPDELAKMSAFGVPGIVLEWTNNQGVRMKNQVALNQISQRHDATFSTEEAAKTYESAVLNQIKIAMQHLRESNDGFSSSQEVEL